MKSFLQGRAPSPVPALRPAPSAPGLAAVCLPPPAPGGPADAATPTVECVKHGGKVTRLLVTCACGSRIEVECLYPDE